MVGLIETSAQTLEPCSPTSSTWPASRPAGSSIEARALRPGDLGRACRGPVRARRQAKGLDLRGRDRARGRSGLRRRRRPRCARSSRNLLSNAVKFTEQAGAVRLTGAGAARRDHDRSCASSVRDTGIGFDEEAAPRLFSRFEQADGSITRRFGGTGLGLAISRSLAEAMGGALDADARARRGLDLHA